MQSKYASKYFVKRNVRMNKITWFALVLAASVCVGLAAKASEIQFATLPQPVQTTVVHETHILGPAHVVRVIREDNGVYAITVRNNPGEAIVYVNSAGRIVRPMATQTV